MENLEVAVEIMQDPVAGTSVAGTSEASPFHVTLEGENNLFRACIVGLLVAYE